MATSLSRIKSQIEKLQKQAATLQHTVISRIKREIAQHGLTVEDLFSAETASFAALHHGSAARKSPVKSKRSATKSAKFSDGQGNTWHGIGKRPQWIHAALDAGRSLEEFLTGAKTGSSAPSAPVSTEPSKKTAGRKRAAGKTVAAVKNAPLKKASKTASASKPAGKTSAASKSDKAATAASVAGKAASKKASPKKVPAKTKTRAAGSSAPATAEVPAAQA